MTYRLNSSDSTALWSPRPPARLVSGGGPGNLEDSARKFSNQPGPAEWRIFFNPLDLRHCHPTAFTPAGPPVELAQPNARIFLAHLSQPRAQCALD